jgi:hypothetical protein
MNSKRHSENFDDNDRQALIELIEEYSVDGEQSYIAHRAQYLLRVLNGEQLEDIRLSDPDAPSRTTLQEWAKRFKTNGPDGLAKTMRRLNAGTQPPTRDKLMSLPPLKSIWRIKF